MLSRRLPFLVLIGVVLLCAVVLFGPLWDTAAGENPLLRPPGPDYEAIVRLGLPTLAVLLTLVATGVWARRQH